MVHQSIDHGSGQGVVNVKDATPVSEGTICGDYNRSEFVSGRDDLKQQVSTAFVNGQIAQFVEQMSVGAQNPPRMGASKPAT
jgi:hypothetical protein